MGYKNLVVEIGDKIAVVKINRPQVLNAMNPETILEFESSLHELNDNPNVGVIIVTGEGKSFVSGSDIAELSKMDSIKAREYSQLGQRVLNKIEGMAKPVIAAINGYALGSGCELAMACDVRVASDMAKFGQPEVKLGLIPGHAGTQRLARIVGLGKAKELVFTGDIIDANEAYRIGLVNKVVPAANLLDEAKSLAKKMLSVGPIALKLAKSAINKSFIDTGSAYESEAFGICFSTDEAKEGMKAFIEKRKPNW
ncbi:MAG: enoyl-CoA hydratase-related protein [bacterium]|nr:enoyl-CoA hydratase-related protein [bacterium]